MLHLLEEWAHWLVVNLGKPGWILGSTLGIHPTATALWLADIPMWEAVKYCVLGSNLMISLFFLLPEGVKSAFRLITLVERLLVNPLRRLFSKPPIRLAIENDRPRSRLGRTWDNFRDAYTEWFFSKGHVGWIIFGMTLPLPFTIHVGLIALRMAKIPRWRSYLILLAVSSFRAALTVWLIYLGFGRFLTWALASLDNWIQTLF